MSLQFGSEPVVPGDCVADDLVVLRHQVRGCTVLALAGELDVATAPCFRKHLAAAVEDGATKVVVDLSRVTFMDLAGVGTLVSALCRTRWARGSICLVGPNREVSRLLSLAGVDSLLPVYLTIDAAVDAPVGA
ncbi:MAG: STAS domain-containing protein [Actinomycetota bacterium]|nr:STAS domain-containing protein [Actinomycetota bacterium]